MTERLEILITATDQASKVLGKIGDTLNNVFKVGLAGTIGGLSALGTGLGLAVHEAMDAEVNLAKLNAVIKSTGGVAGMSADEASDLADSLSKVTRFSDDTILSAETMLLTFTNIGENVFPQATEAVLNMGEMFGGTESAAIQLGKALNDPIEGVTALRRVGVALTQQQEDQIKAMVEAGNVAGAQKIILGELEKEFGGVARAAGQTASGQLTIFKNKLLNIAEGLGTVLLPIVVRLGTAIADRLIPFFEHLALVLGNFASGLASGDMDMVKETLGWLLGNQGWSNDIAFFLVDLAQGFKNLFDIFSEFGVSGVFTLQFWWELNQIFGSEWGNRIREIAVSFGELYLQVKDLMDRVIVPFIQEHSDIFINAFERLGAIFAGGLGIGIVTGLLTGLGAIIGTLLSPIVLLIAGVTALSVAYDTNFLGMKDAVDSFVNWFKSTAMPAVIDFVTDKVLPALGDLKDWFVTDALPAIIDFVTHDFIPFTLDLWAAIKDIWEKVKVPLGELFTWFVEDALPAIGDFIINTAIPFIGDLWKEIQKLWDMVSPYLDQLLDWFTVTALPAVRNFLVNDVIPAVGQTWRELQYLWDKAGPKLTEFYNFVLSKIGWLTNNVFAPLRDAIGWVIEKIRELVNAIGGIHWPTPPSWITGPLGLNSGGGQQVTGQLAQSGLYVPQSGAGIGFRFPGFQDGGDFRGLGMTGEGGRELVYAPQGAMVLPHDLTERILAARGNTYNLSLNTMQSGGGVMDEFRLMEAWGR